jgi:hypothetical protein
MLGIGGGGGAPPIGGGGGPGGGGGAEPAGIGGGGGMPAGGAGLAAGESLLSIEDNGRGGAIVPNKIEARCLAPPCVGASSSSEDESSESTTDQSSSSCRPRVRADGAAGSLNVGTAALVACSCVKRWNGFVDTSLVVLAGGGVLLS